MIERRISLDFKNNQSMYYTYLLDNLHTKYESNITQWSTCPSADQSQYLACSTAWIDEDVELNCAHVYRDEQNKPLSIAQQFSLGQTYYNTRMVFLEERLLQSGVRLGVVLNKIVELQKHGHHKKGEGELCSGKMLLALIIVLEVLLVFLCFTYYRFRRTFYRQPLADAPPKYHIFDGVKA
jgi:hypothetical protein